MAVTGQRTRSTTSGLRTLDNVMQSTVNVNGTPQQNSLLVLYSKMPYKGVTDREFKYYEDDYLPHEVVTTAGSTAASTTITIGTANIGAFVPELVWKNKRTQEVVRVVSVNPGAGTLTVLRSFGSTAAAVINSGDTLLRMGPSQGEVAQRQTFQSTQRSSVTKYCEKKRWDILLTEDAIKNALHVEDEWKYQVKKQMEQATKDLASWLYGSEGTSGTVDSQEHYTATGLREAISTNILSSSGVLYEKALMDFLNDIMIKGSGSRTIFASSAFIAALEEIGDSVYTRNTNGVKLPGLGLLVNTLHTRNGTVSVIEDRTLSQHWQGEAYVLDLPELAFRDFSNNGLSGKLQYTETIPENTEDTRNAKLQCTLGIDCGPEVFHGRITGVTSGAGGSATQ